MEVASTRLRAGLAMTKGTPVEVTNDGFGGCNAGW